MSPEIKDILAELRPALEALYGERLVKLILFGSQARGDAEPGSDIDLLLVLDGPFRTGEEIARVGEVTANLSLKYNVVITCTFVSAERYLQEQSPLLINVRREGVAL